LQGAPLNILAALALTKCFVALPIMINAQAYQNTFNKEREFDRAYQITTQNFADVTAISAFIDNKSDK
jgi:hypothetical protein